MGTEPSWAASGGLVVPGPCRGVATLVPACICGSRLPSTAAFITCGDDFHQLVVSQLMEDDYEVEKIKGGS